jgi:hypothetical protein
LFPHGKFPGNKLATKEPRFRGGELAKLVVAFGRNPSPVVLP